ncbi:MAG: MFS transporter, partial [Actinomycetales bacterium]
MSVRDRGERVGDRGERAQLALTLLVAGTFFMENLDGTILATAAPTIGRAYGIGSAAVGIAITAYLVTLAVLIPISGWLTERLGARTVFAGAIAVFTIASALCAASGDLAQLTVMRVLQGAGGAMMVPVGRLAVLRVTEKRDLVRAIAWLTWPALVAPIFAPLVGGLLVTYASWQWIFLLNIPLGGVAFVAAVRLTPMGEASSRKP